MATEPTEPAAAAGAPALPGRRAAHRRYFWLPPGPPVPARYSAASAVEHQTAYCVPMAAGTRSTASSGTAAAAPRTGRNTSAGLCIDCPWDHLPLRFLESSAGVEPAPSRCACGCASSCASCSYGRAVFPGTPSGFRHRSHYKTRREGDLNPSMSSAGCPFCYPGQRPRHRVAACVRCRAAGLSRLSCVTGFRIATAFCPCGGWLSLSKPAKTERS